MRATLPAASLTAMALAWSSCTPAEERVLPRVESLDGVEIATLPELPSMLDPDYAWSVRALRRIHTQRPGSDEPLVFDPSGALELEGGCWIPTEGPGSPGSGGAARARAS